MALKHLIRHRQRYDLMSGTRKHDWPVLIQEWVLMKTQESLLTQNEFFRRKGISTPAGNRKIGKKMTLAWEEAQKTALNQIVEKAGINLGEELERQFKVAKTIHAIAARAIIPRPAADGSEIPADQQPASFAEALMLLKTGGDAMRDITKILTGGEPLLPPKPVQGVIEWVPPPPSKHKKRKAR